MAEGEPAPVVDMTILERCSKALQRARTSLMPNCREMCRRSSDSFERKLGLLERIGGSVHLAVCAACRRYRAQIQLLHRAARRWRPESGSAKRLSPESRERMKQAIRQHGQDGDCDHDHG